MQDSQPTRRTGRLAGRIAISSGLICAIGFAGWIAMYGAIPIVNRMVEADIRHRTKAWQDQVTAFITDVPAAFGNGRIDAGDVDMLRRVLEASDIFRLQIYDTTGNPILSSAGPHSQAPALEPERRSTTVMGGVFYTLTRKSALEVL